LGKSEAQDGFIFLITVVFLDKVLDVLGNARLFRVFDVFLNRPTAHGKCLEVIIFTDFSISL
jgi:hypothetical protein